MFKTETYRLAFVLMICLAICCGIFLPRLFVHLKRDILSTVPRSLASLDKNQDISSTAPRSLAKNQDILSTAPMLQASLDKNQDISSTSPKSLVSLDKNQDTNSDIVTTCTSRLTEYNIQRKRLERIYSSCRRLGKLSNITEQYEHQIYKSQKNMILVDEKHHVTLLGLQKAGSSTWKLALLNSSGTLKSSNVKGIHTPGTFKRAKGVYTNMACLMDPQHVFTALRNDCVILNVRHPFDRLESAYADKVVAERHGNVRTTILKNRGLSAEEVDRLKNNGSNIQFHEFMHHILSHNDHHWEAQFKISFTCVIPYGYIAKLETMTGDLDIVTNQLLSGYGTNKKWNVRRKNTTVSTTYTTTRGRYLPIFSKLENKTMWVDKMAEYYKYDLEVFGYSYYFDDNGDLFATCVEYDSIGNCI